MTLTDFPEVQALSPREKLELVDELWRALAPELDALEVPQDVRETLDERWTAFLQNPASALTLEQFQDRMRALRS